jgi:hypothetical protein
LSIVTSSTTLSLHILHEDIPPNPFSGLPFFLDGDPTSMTCLAKNQFLDGSSDVAMEWVWFPANSCTVLKSIYKGQWSPTSVKTRTAHIPSRVDSIRYCSWSAYTRAQSQFWCAGCTVRGRDAKVVSMACMILSSIT